jgi:hypothetical protein
MIGAMTTLIVNIDEHTASGLRRLCEPEGSEPDALAARLLSRAVRAARPRPVYDIEILKATCAEHAAEEEALAESDAEARAELLAQEDAA